MLKFGFELEMFCLNEASEPILVPAGLPYDECGWLVEVRSEPHTDILKAVHLFKAEIERIQVQGKEKAVTLVCVPLMKIPRELKVQAARLHTKGLLKFQNIYGHETHKARSDFGTASIHVSFTNEAKYNYTCGSSCKKCKHVDTRSFTYQGFIDHAKYISALDRAFKDEICKAKRNPGFYEIKPDGRIEYRSLPNDIDLNKLTAVLQEITK